MTDSRPLAFTQALSAREFQARVRIHATAVDGDRRALFIQARTEGLRTRRGMLLRDGQRHFLRGKYCPCTSGGQHIADFSCRECRGQGVLP